MKTNALAVAVAMAIVAACGRSEQNTTLALQNDLSEMRKAIRDFRAEKHRPPKSLQELVQTHYLRTIPADPKTGKADWRVITEESVRLDEFSSAAPLASAAGIADVHSAAPGKDAGGKRWSEY